MLYGFPTAFLNRNGADVYVFPRFIVILESPSRVGILDVSELEVDYWTTRFIETDKTAPDSKRVGED